MPPGRPKREIVGIAEVWIDRLEDEIRYARAIRFPSPVFQKDPAAFCRRILGVEPWFRQVEILESVRDFTRVAVSSGHKIGKSRSAAMLALWFYCSYTDARVVFTSTTSRQVDEILWREMRMVLDRSGRCVDCKNEIEQMRKRGVRDPEAEIPRPCPHSALIDGDCGDLAKTGLKSKDFRQIVGFTAKQKEAVAGISGANLLYLPDEASGIPQEIFEAMEGNRAGGARMCMFSNPTQNEGEFFDAFYSKKDLYKTITVSSEETPNVQQGIENLIPGLANPSWIEEKEREWGRESALFKIRVLGQHALNLEKRIFSVHQIGEAQERWERTEAKGRLYIGIDPAGESGQGDDSGFAVRRGNKVLDIQLHIGLTAEGHLVHLLLLLNEHRLPREKPVVVMDREGPVGNKVYNALYEYLDENPEAFELVGIKASNAAARDPMIYDRMRDELAANLLEWVREGGALPENVKLEVEMHIFEWRQSANNGKLKLHPPKEVIRKTPAQGGLGRSPDTFDCVALSCWEPLAFRDGELPEGAPGSKAADDDEDDSRPVMDPYAGASLWGRK